MCSRRPSAFAIVAACALNNTEAVVEHSIVKSLVRRIEAIRLLSRVVARRERAVLAPVFASDIDAAPLNECRASRLREDSSSSELLLKRGSEQNERRPNACSSPLCGVAVRRSKCRFESSAILLGARNVAGVLSGPLRRSVPRRQLQTEGTLVRKLSRLFSALM